MKLASLFLGYCLQDLKFHLAYRGDLIAEGIGFLAMVVVELAMVWYVVAPVPALAGWTQPQMVFMYSLCLTSVALFFATGLNLFYLPGDYIVGGQLDRLLVRPVDPYVQLLMERLSASDLVTFFAGIGLTAWSLQLLKMPLTLPLLGYLIAAVLGGGMILLGLMTAFASVSFWLKDKWGALWSVFPMLENVARLPLNIFPRSAQFVLSTLLPLGFVTFYPVATLFADSRGPLWGYGTLAVGIITMGVGYGCWRLGLRSYESSGA
ncbi:MAG: ABC-2 family transporter protein [bacterium]